MSSAFDVARYIGSKSPELVRPDATSAERAKLQKLLYYAQAWNLAWRGSPLFAEPIQAWKRGPVCAALYHAEKDGLADLQAAPHLSPLDRAVIDRTLDRYGDRSGSELSDLTHREDPWRDARAGLPHDAPSENVISLESMRAYFSDLSMSAEERAEELSLDEVERWIDTNYADVMTRLAQ